MHVDNCINELSQVFSNNNYYILLLIFSLIAAAVTFVMGQNVAKDRLFFQKQKKLGGDSKGGTMSSPPHGNMGSWGVDCGGASKGLFLGLLCLVTGIVVIIIFLVVKEEEDFPAETVFWLTSGTLMAILTITFWMTVAGLVQIRKLSVVGRCMTHLDTILTTVTVLGVQLYTVFGIVVGAVGIIAEDGIVPDGALLTAGQKRHAMLLSVSAIQLLQVWF